MTSPTGTPFLTLTGFQTLWDGAPLTPQQQARVSMALQVASNWIYDRVGGIQSTDPTGEWVVLQVVSNWLRYGKYGPLSSFTKTTGHRTDAGTMSADIQRYFTDEYKMLLGIPLASLPMTSCAANDFNASDDSQGWPTTWSTSYGNLGWDFWGVTND